MYSDVLLSRFLDPAHAGDLEEPDGVGQAGNLTCGDVVQLAIKVSDDRIADARFRALGCATAIAAADLVCEQLIGQSIISAGFLDENRLAESLGGVPPERMGCAAIVVDSVRQALEQLRSAPPVTQAT